MTITRTVIVKQRGPSGKKYQYAYQFTDDGKYIPKFPGGKQISEYPTSRMNMCRCLERDRYTCQICGATDNLDAHHKDGKSAVKVGSQANNTLDNLITLCGRCHQRTHWGTLERDQDIMRRRKSGQTLEEIGILYGISRQRVFSVIKYMSQKQESR